MTHRLIFKVAAWMVLLVSIGHAAERPNILVLFCDDLGYGDLGCYGNPVIRTPHLDRFAAESLRLTACYAGAPNCSPSRATLLTGRAASRVGLYDVVRGSAKDMELREWEVTIPELLRPAGYQTYHVGKWHLSRGDDEDEAGVPGTPGAPGPRAARNRGRDTTEPLKHGFDVTDGGGMNAIEAADLLIDWLTGWQGDQPFFAYVAFGESHEPVAQRSIPEFRKQYETAEAAEAAKRVPYGWVERSRRTQEDQRSAYYGVVSQMDAAVGKLLAHLDTAGLAENTFIIFTSDNGPEHRGPASFGSPGPLRGAKGHLHEGGIRVPGIIRWPGRVKGAAVSDEPIGVVDLLPTFCEIAGVEPPRDRKIDGVSIVPAITAGRPLERSVPMFWSFWAGRGGYQYAMREGDWKLLAATEPLRVDRPLIEHIRDAEFARFALFNVADDISESRELSAEQPQVLARMKQRFLSLYGEIMSESPAWDMESYRDKANGLWSPRPRNERPRK